MQNHSNSILVEAGNTGNALRPRIRRSSPSALAVRSLRSNDRARACRRDRRTPCCSQASAQISRLPKAVAATRARFSSERSRPDAARTSTRWRRQKRVVGVECKVNPSEPLEPFGRDRSADALACILRVGQSISAGGQKASDRNGKSPKKTGSATNDAGDRHWNPSMLRPKGLRPI